LTWLDTLPKVFWYGSIALEALLCVRLFSNSFWREYPRFTLFVGVLCIESIALAIIRPYGQTLYGEVWIVSRSVALVLESLAVVEIFSRWAHHFPGIDTFGRKLFAGLAIGALVAASATLPADASRAGWVFAYQITSVVNREIHLLLAVFLALMIGFFVFFGGPVAPNLRRHTWLMLWFLSATGASYFSSTVARTFWLTSILMPAASFSALVGWLAAFRRGQDVRVPAAPSPADLAEYHAAEALSQTLLRFGERITLRGLLGLK
jgi:hypothetical protein